MDYFEFALFIYITLGKHFYLLPTDDRLSYPQFTKNENEYYILRDNFKCLAEANQNKFKLVSDKDWYIKLHLITKGISSIINII